jgi:hypothetical protein
MKNLIAFLFSLAVWNIHSQNIAPTLIAQNTNRLVKFEVIENKNPLPGASIYIKSMYNFYSITTDFEGSAQIEIPNDISKIEISFIGPYVSFTLKEHIDFVKIDFDKRKVFFFENKKLKKKIKLKLLQF